MRPSVPELKHSPRCAGLLSGIAAKAQILDLRSSSVAVYNNCEKPCQKCAIDASLRRATTEAVQKCCAPTQLNASMAHPLRFWMAPEVYFL
jgi:hypothetical protein